jgi:hypothetical protein
MMMVMVMIMNWWWNDDDDGDDDDDDDDDGDNDDDFVLQTPIGTAGFHIEDGNQYCTKDWNELFTTKCYGCDFPIEPSDRWVEALGQNWHAECFNCAVSMKQGPEDTVSWIYFFFISTFPLKFFRFAKPTWKDKVSMQRADVPFAKSTPALDSGNVADRGR